jgi:hypothetical protein
LTGQHRQRRRSLKLLQMRSLKPLSLHRSKNLGLRRRSSLQSPHKSKKPEQNEQPSGAHKQNKWQAPDPAQGCHKGSL